MSSEPVVVLGMHRSGTSFLIRALNLSGLWLGPEDTLSTIAGRAMSGNPKGNYESRGAIAINNAILAKSGGSWFCPPPRLRSDAADLQRIQAFCAGLQSDGRSAHVRWGWKDPRTLLTLEVWRQALQRPIFVVGSFRHPTAVAQSLLARDKIPLEIGYALWNYYNSRLLSALKIFPHALVRFDVDRDTLVAQVLRVCERSGLIADREQIASWHDAELVRAKTAGEQIPDDAQMGSLWRELLERYQSQVSE